MNLNDVILDVKKREDEGDSPEEILQSIKSLFEEYQYSGDIESLENEINKIPEDHKFQDNSIETKNGNKVYFRDIENKLINEIDTADVVLGAVAWIKKDEVISALSKKNNVFIIVDKAPIFNVNTSKLNHNQLKERAKLIKAYKNLKCNLNPYQFDNLLNKLSEDCDPRIDPIKCAGKEKTKGSYSLMHNKFLIFAKTENQCIEVNGKNFCMEKVKPYAVWTGSFNFTYNATQSLENALIITDDEIVNAYFKEFGQIAAISEKLVWTSQYPRPDWKFN